MQIINWMFDFIESKQPQYGRYHYHHFATSSKDKTLTDITIIM